MSESAMQVTSQSCCRPTYRAFALIGPVIGTGKRTVDATAGDLGEPLTSRRSSGSKTSE